MSDPRFDSKHDPATGIKTYQTFDDPIVELWHPDTHATIRYVGDGFVLWWTDGVVNEWEETYPRLDVAIMRLGLLMACAHDDWRRGFNADPPTFYRGATEFVDLCATFTAGHSDI